MKHRKIRWTGYAWRSKGTLENITKWKPNTKQPRGPPRKRWVHRIKKDLRMLGVENTKEMSRDRKKLRDVVIMGLNLNGL